MDYGDYYWGFYRDYYRDPFPHSLQSTRQLQALKLMILFRRSLGFCIGVMLSYRGRIYHELLLWDIIL